MMLQKIKAVLIVSVAFGMTAQADDRFKHYETLGDFVLTNLSSAPFPHTNRADGHIYHNEKFSAAEHYQDNTVAIFVPKEVRPTNTLDLIFHFHGWRNSVTNVLAQYELIDQLVESGRKAALVVPQGPLNAPDSYDGKLEDEGGFDRLLTDVISVLQKNEKFKNVQPGKIILSGHSGGYQVMSSILAQPKVASRVREAWLFDGLYARTEKFTGWFEKNPQTRFIDLYTEHGGTKDETEKLMNDLRTRQVSFFAGNERSVAPDELRTNKLVFLFSDLAHDDVLEKRRTFRVFAETSSLEGISNHRIFVSPRNRDVPGTRVKMDSGSLYIPNYFKADTNKADVLLFFLGASWCSEQNLYDARKSAVLLTMNATNAAVRFQDVKQFEAVLKSISEVLSTNKICTNGIGSVSLASFSGGYVAVREVLKHEQLAKEIKAVVLADSLYASRDGKHTNQLDAQQMKPFLDFAERAAKGNGEFWFSQLYPPEAQYRDNTTTLAANYLIEKIKAERRPGQDRTSQGAYIFYRADKGNFHVFGYEGMDNQDHFDHFYALSDLLKQTSLKSAAP